MSRRSWSTPRKNPGVDQKRGYYMLVRIYAQMVVICEQRVASDMTAAPRVIAARNPSISGR